MARTTASEVKEIMISSNLTEEQLEPFILVAHLYVNDVFGSDDEAIRTREIERWFVAHIASSVYERVTSEEKIGDAQIKYAAKYGDKLNSTPYGQMILQMDTTGKMAKTGKALASIHAIKSFE